MKREYISDWIKASNLTRVTQDISGYGYSEEFIDAYRLRENRHYHCSSGNPLRTNYYEPLEVAIIDGEICCRENENRVHAPIKDSYTTQFGSFTNHNHGEFISWLGKDDYDGLSPKEREIQRQFGMEDFFIDGNYCDVFDCGNYVIAVSNLMHMASGDFKIIRIDEDLKTETLYDNTRAKYWSRYEYLGRVMEDQGFILIVSGKEKIKPGIEGKRSWKIRTILFKIDENGECSIFKEWDKPISSANSVIRSGRYLYFGQNKQVTRWDLSTGEAVYYTNKTQEELNDLKPLW